MTANPRSAQHLRELLGDLSNRMLCGGFCCCRLHSLRLQFTDTAHPVWAMHAAHEREFRLPLLQLALD
jgi:hypothetical protein